MTREQQYEMLVDDADSTPADVLRFEDEDAYEEWKRNRDG